ARSDPDTQRPAATRKPRSRQARPALRLLLAAWLAAAGSPARYGESPYRLLPAAGCACCGHRPPRAGHPVAGANPFRH
ncbi:hypothetical protein H6F38_36415, partial [Paenibacillus sp. EKM208P]